jgi:hypothetical protein
LLLKSIYDFVHKHDSGGLWSGLCYGEIVLEVWHFTVQKGQANYAASNAFLDSFASYRHHLGRPACAVELGVIEDEG